MISSSYPASLGNVRQIEGAWAEHFSVRVRHPSRGSRQALGVEVHSERDQECGRGLFRGGQVGSFRRFDDMQCRLWGSLSWFGAVDQAGSRLASSLTSL